MTGKGPLPLALSVVYFVIATVGSQLLQQPRIMILAGAGALTVLVWVFTIFLYQEYAPTIAEGTSPAEPSAARTDTTQPPNVNSDSVDELARAILGRLPTPVPAPPSSRPSLIGPFPPFSLGGSLLQGDLIDIDYRGLGTDWRPVRKHVDVEIDWSQYADGQLVVDALVRGGTCRIGIWDVQNEYVVAESEWLKTAPAEWEFPSTPARPDLLMEVKRVQIPLPPSVGKKKYRLVVRNPHSGSHTYWVQGAISFPVISLGGTFTERFTPNEATNLVGQVPLSVEAVVDWNKVTPPINSVIAEITLAAWHPVFQTSERARAIVRDLSDDSQIESDWMAVEWIGGMMASNRPYPGPTANRYRVALPRKTGQRRYALEVEVSKLGMSASARGFLLLRH